jgi:hypothetical protein
LETGAEEPEPAVSSASEAEDERVEKEEMKTVSKINNDTSIECLGQ